MRGRKRSLIRTAGRHGQLDAAAADRHERPDLEQLAADRAAAGIRQVARLQGDAARALEQDIGHRGKPQSQLVGAVGERVHPALFDAVLHLTARAVDSLKDLPRLDALHARQSK